MRRVLTPARRELWSHAVCAGLAAVALALALGPAPQAAAGIWVYEDEQGRLHYADTPRHAGYRPLRLKPRPGVVIRPAATDAWDGVIARAGRTHGVKPGLVKAVVHVESLFDRTAISRKGAQGLMQLMPQTARSLGVDDPFDAWQNIEGGTRYLGYLMERFEGDLKLALAAYNAGETNVRRFGGVPPFQETRSYVKRVMALYRRYDADFR